MGDIKVINDLPNSLPPLNFSPGEAKELGLPSGTEVTNQDGSTMSIEDSTSTGVLPFQVTEEQMELYLKVFFEAHAAYFKHEHWLIDLDKDIAMMKAPAMLWVNAQPWAVSVVQKVEKHSFPALFLYAYLKRLFVSLKLKKQEKEQQEAGYVPALNGGQNSGQQSAVTNGIRNVPL